MLLFFFFILKYQPQQKQLWVQHLTSVCSIGLRSRDERRWIEKQNRASRAQRKKEEMNRIRTLVGTHPQSGDTLRDDANDAPVDTVFHPLVLFADTAYGCDPRIKKFKDEEKARKESEKKAKADAKKRGQEEKEKVSVL